MPVKKSKKFWLKILLLGVFLGLVFTLLNFDQPKIEKEKITKSALTPLSFAVQLPTNRQ